MELMVVTAGDTDIMERWDRDDDFDIGVWAIDRRERWEATTLPAPQQRDEASTV